PPRAADRAAHSAVAGGAAPTATGPPHGRRARDGRPGRPPRRSSWPTTGAAVVPLATGVAAGVQTSAISPGGGSWCPPGGARSREPAVHEVGYVGQDDAD